MKNTYWTKHPEAVILAPSPERKGALLMRLRPKALEKRPVAVVLSINRM